MLLRGVAELVPAVVVIGVDRRQQMVNTDLILAAPSAETNRIQEYHMMIYHLLCAAVEEELFVS